VHLTEALHMPIIDGIGSIVIGLILCGVASFLVWESKKLLLGEAADPEMRDGIRHIARENGNVADVARMMTLHMGPNTLVLNMDLQFDETLDAEAVATAIDRMERKIREAYPSVRFIFIEAESLTGRQVPEEPSPS
jgi:divalent metal cation (Fe/Co/Zn/Cd) transporter